MTAIAGLFHAPVICSPMVLVRQEEEGGRREEEGERAGGRDEETEGLGEIS
jgi:hypothetical protein